MKTISKRQLANAERARRIVTDLIASLDATTSYAEREPRRREKLPWRALYGWQLAVYGDGILDADGKPTGFTVRRKFTHEPGDIVTSSPKRTNAPARRYMVREDRSLRTI